MVHLYANDKARCARRNTNITHADSTFSTMAKTLARGQKAKWKDSKSKSPSGTFHSFSGMSRKFDPRVVNVTESSNAIPNVPPETSTALQVKVPRSAWDSMGSKLFHPLQYSSRAARQSFKGAFVRGFRCNPEPKRSISYCIEGESRTRPRKA